jgi:hypothetical protein
MRKTSRNWKRAFAQSTYITVTWNWFLTLAAKAAEPVLVASVLYASVKFLPIVHFPPQYDVVVFIAQFVALDIGGLSLNTLADQAKQDGNDEGAKQAKHLSLALVAVMLIGVIMAGVDQVVKLDGQIGTVIDTVLLIARAVMAVLYSRVIHSLRNDEGNQYATYEKEEIDEVIAEMVQLAVQEVVSHLESSLSQSLDERLTGLDVRHAEAMARFKAEQTTAISETHKTIMTTLEIALQTSVRETRQPTEIPPSSKTQPYILVASRCFPGSSATLVIRKLQRYFTELGTSLWCRRPSLRCLVDESISPK